MILTSMLKIGTAVRIGLSIERRDRSRRGFGPNNALSILIASESADARAEGPTLSTLSTGPQRAWQRLNGSAGEALENERLDPMRAFIVYGGMFVAVVIYAWLTAFAFEPRFRYPE